MVRLWWMAGLSVVLLLTVSTAGACPLCNAPGLSLSEFVAQSDVAVLGQRLSARKPEADFNGETVFEARELIKVAPPPSLPLAKRDRITLPRYREGNPEALFLLLGQKGPKIDWSEALDMTPAGYEYLRQAPPTSVEWPERLRYFVRFLEHEDPLIAQDAYTEFAHAPYEAVVAIRLHLPRERIRQWVSNPKTVSIRLGLFGLLIGLCGEKSDAEQLEKMIRINSVQERLGVDGLISGYVLLTGTDGLKLVDDIKLRNAEAPFLETMAALSALRFFWTYSPETVGRERLKESMRLLLDRPDYFELVLADLARWKDWSIQDRIVALYGTEGVFQESGTRKAIIKFLLVCARDVPKPDERGENPQPEHARKARLHLETLRAKDPRLVAQTERFFEPQ